MGRPEESKIFPTHSVALTIPFKPLRAGIVFWIPLVCVLVTFFTYAKVFWMVRTRI